MYTTTSERGSQWELTVQLRELKPGFHNNLEGQEGLGGGRTVKEGRDTCIPVADSYGCMAEAIQYYEAIFLQLKINKFGGRGR